MAGKLDNSQLHAQTNAEKWNLVRSGKVDRLYHAFDAPSSETTGDKYSSDSLKLPMDTFPFQLLRVNKADVHFTVIADAPVNQSFIQAFI